MLICALEKGACPPGTILAFANQGKRRQKRCGSASEGRNLYSMHKTWQIAVQMKQIRGMDEMGLKEGSRGERGREFRVDLGSDVAAGGRTGLDAPTSRFSYDGRLVLAISHRNHLRRLRRILVSRPFFFTHLPRLPSSFVLECLS